MMLSDVMTTDVLTTSPETSVTDAAKAMADRKVGSACVVGADGQLEGIITERDVMRAAASGRDLTEERVTEWMTADPVVVGPDTLPSEVASTMVDRNFRHLPVCDSGELVGIVSMRDVWRFSFLPSEPDDMTLR